MDPEVLKRLRLARQPKEKKKPKPIARQSEKAKAKLKEEKDTFEQDKLFYAEHWAASPHKCEECGTGLGNEPLTLFFHHAIPKRLRPGLRHVHENIIVLCPDCHSQAETDISKVPYVQQRTGEIKKLLL